MSVARRKGQEVRKVMNKKIEKETRAQGTRHKSAGFNLCTYALTSCALIKGGFMKKLVGLFLSVALATVLFVGVSEAANPDTFVINVTCQRELSVNVTTGTAAGEMNNFYTATISSSNIATNASIVISTPLAVWNNSPISAASIQNYSLQATAGNTGLIDDAIAWNATTGSGQADRWVLAAVFTNNTTWNPPTSEFSADTTDVITKGSAKSWVAAGGAHSPATAGNRHANETAHRRNTAAADLLLWIGVGSPSATSLTGQSATFTITVTAI